MGNNNSNRKPFLHIQNSENIFPIEDTIDGSVMEIENPILEIESSEALPPLRELEEGELTEDEVEGNASENNSSEWEEGELDNDDDLEGDLQEFPAAPTHQPENPEIRAAPSERAYRKQKAINKQRWNKNLFVKGPRSCDKCLFTTSSKSKYYYHKKKEHGNIARGICQYCSKIFSTKGSQIRHEKSACQQAPHNVNRNWFDDDEDEEGIDGY